MNENPLQGSFIVDELTDLVEEAVLAEFDRITERGGVLGAMETGYQRGRIQDESMLYEHAQARRLAADRRRQHLPRPGRRRAAREVELARAHARRRSSRSSTGSPTSTPAHAAEAPAALAPAAGRGDRRGGNVFAVLMDAVRVCSLGQITEAFFEVGGQYRRNV